MIKNININIKVSPNSRAYYNSIGYLCINYEFINVKIIDLPIGSNINIDIICDNCLSELSTKYNKYYKSTNKLTDKYYCKKCNHIKAKKTKLERYGDESYTNRDKAKKTKLERYGDESYTNRDKANSTCLLKYGVKNVSQVKEVQDKKVRTYIDKYNCENPFQSEIIKERIKETNVKKWGTEYYLSSDDSKEKYTNFCKKFGVSHYSKSQEFKDKFENTCLSRWGEKTNLMDSGIKDRIKETNIIKYGFDHAMKNKIISLLNTKSLIENRLLFFDKLGYEYINYDYEKSLYKLKKKECSHIFEINYDLFRSRIKYNNSSCMVCYPKNELSSIKEKEMVNWLKSLSITVIENDRTLIKKEIDIYLPDFKIGIEFNGLYYHSDKFKNKTYHIDKTNRCHEIGIELLHIWEDDWVYKTNIVKSIISNRLKLSNKVIYARKCELRLIDSKISKIFLNENHIQGNTTSSIQIGLYNNEILVSVMTFGNRRINSQNSFELIRFCNLINYTIVGGASKIFKYFKNNYDVDKIVSYSDISIFNGGLYEKLGFKNDGRTVLNYYWTDLNIKYHRFNFNKKKLVKMGYDERLTGDQIMSNIGYYKIWSCGQIRWIYE
jgi:hypothetical protein